MQLSLMTRPYNNIKIIYDILKALPFKNVLNQLILNYVYKYLVIMWQWRKLNNAIQNTFFDLRRRNSLLVSLRQRRRLEKSVV